MEYLRLLLPRAGDLGTLQVATRSYNVTAYVNRSAGAFAARIATASYVPSLATLSVSILIGAQMVANLSGDNGVLPLNVTWQGDEPLLLSVTNLSVDAEVILTVPVEGIGYGSGMARG